MKKNRLELYGSLISSTGNKHRAALVALLLALLALAGAYVTYGSSGWPCVVDAIVAPLRG